MTGEIVLSSVTVPALHEPLGSVIFLHGSGGSSVREQMRKVLGQDLTFDHLDIHYPTPPPSNYSLSGGALQRVWFDRLDLNISSEEQVDSVNKMASTLDKFIERETQKGVPEKRIFLGGHSMGGGMALHVGLRMRTFLAGIFCIASFLNDDSQVYQHLSKNENQRFPPVLMIHGNKDEDVLLPWAETTRAKLESFGVNVTFKTAQGATHNIVKPELVQLRQWLEDIWQSSELRDT